MLLAGVALSTLKVPPEVKNSPWYGVLPDREKQFLAYQYNAEPHACVHELSQSMKRAGSGVAAGSTGPDASGQSVCHKTIVPRANLWVRSQNRLLTGYEACLMQGLPVDTFPNADEIPRALWFDLAGNMFSAASYLAVLCALFSSLPADFEFARSESDGEDVLFSQQLASSVLNIYQEEPM
jgi:hypothetical protein